MCDWSSRRTAEYSRVKVNEQVMDWAKKCVGQKNAWAKKMREPATQYYSSNDAVSDRL